jgi:hypothetical protein
MKPSKLSQACLLDVSGELGAEASELLREHVETYPAGMLEYDQALSTFKQLNSLPPLESQMDQVSRERLKQQVKRAVHRAVGQQQKTARLRTMRRWFYRSMSIASGVAAAMVVMAGVYIVRQHIQAHQARVMDAENTFQEMAESHLPYRANTSIRQIRASIDRFGSRNMFDAQSGADSAGMMQLFNALDKIPVPGAEDGLPQSDNIQ